MARSLITLVRLFWSQEHAATATEYAIMLSLLVAVVFAAIPSVGFNPRTTFGQALPDADLPDVVFVSRATLSQSS
jgi:Flp pilus assembly pilin Flp